MKTLLGFLFIFFFLFKHNPHQFRTKIIGYMYKDVNLKNGAVEINWKRTNIKICCKKFEHLSNKPRGPL